MSQWRITSGLYEVCAGAHCSIFTPLFYPEPFLYWFLVIAWRPFPFCRRHSLAVAIRIANAGGTPSRLSLAPATSTRNPKGMCIRYNMILAVRTHPSPFLPFSPFPQTTSLTFPLIVRLPRQPRRRQPDHLLQRGAPGGVSGRAVPVAQTAMSAGSLVDARAEGDVGVSEGGDVGEEGGCGL